MTTCRDDATAARSLPACSFACSLPARSLCARPKSARPDHSGRTVCYTSGDFFWRRECERTAGLCETGVYSKQQQKRPPHSFWSLPASRPRCLARFLHYLKNKLAAGINLPWPWPRAKCAAMFRALHRAVGARCVVAHFRRRSDRELNASHKFEPHPRLFLLEPCMAQPAS